ncbi:HNH endonuclease [Rhizobiaceae bacterium LC148]|nr:endonuclease [Rhizobium sp. LC145]TKT58343.1 HNH endonuclease [Rhizobiaceae bacterium LC148]
MGRLKTLKPRIGTLAPRIGRAPGDEQARLRERDQNVSWRSWYKTARWQKLRQQVLVRDHYTCQRTGVLCTGKYPDPHSPVVDHIRPHRGDEQLFWDPNNLHCVSKTYHDSEKQKQERAQARW